MASSKKTSWFGPKRIGWGWRPVTWQGWAVTAAFILAVILTVSRLGKTTAGYSLLVLEIGVFFVVVLFTSRKRV